MYNIEDIKNTILCGDALKILKEIPDESIDMVITSPPYFQLRDYQVEGQIGLEPTFDEFFKKILEITAEIKRVLKKSGSFWLNLGDTYEGKCMMMQPERIALKMIDEQGWILRQKIVWAKQILINKENRTIGSVMPTSVKDRFNMSYEMLYHFVKSKKYYFNLDAVRISPIREYWNENLFLRILEKEPISGNYVYKKGAKLGLVTDLPKSKFNYRVRDAERKAGQSQFKASEEEIKKYQTNPDPRGDNKGGPGSYRLWKDTHPYPYQGKFSGMEEEAEKYGSPRARTQRKVDAYIEGKVSKNVHHGQSKTANALGLTSFEYSSLHPNPLGKNIPTVWLINPQPHNFKRELNIDYEHFAVFPDLLPKIPILSSCPPDGIVLDPFAGSGTTLLVAKQLGRNYLGIELNPNYVKISQARLNLTQPKLL